MLLLYIWLVVVRENCLLMMVVREKIRLKSTALEDHLKSTTLVAGQIQARVFCLDFPDVPFLAEIIPFFTVASQRAEKKYGAHTVQFTSGLYKCRT